jgi:hypothetical protein
MKRWLTILILLFIMTACAQNPHPPVKSTMDPAHAEATTAAFIATRQAKTAEPTFVAESGSFVMLVCLDCTAQAVGINIWEFAGSNPGEVLIVVPDQTVVEVLDSVMADDGHIWYQVRFNGHMGWVAADFVKDIDA